MKLMSGTAMMLLLRAEEEKERLTADGKVPTLDEIKETLGIETIEEAQHILEVLKNGEH